ncbi:MAG TPA: ABC transporter ATP-binding protein [Thermoanaerobaculia bacterium]|nr:ABC transporter ATP-binding protein [Thermoanaerobaculia bacterium]
MTPSGAPAPFLVLDGLAKRFGGHTVLDGVALAVERGEVLALLGPSGSGKTTLLRLLAGFETPDAGRILVAGERLDTLPPARRNVGMVFQHYALFPHLSVGENVGFGLRLPRAEAAARVAAALASVDLEGFERRRVGEISGGQQQRVALARALAPEPRLLLLDEPLSNLDPTLRERTRRELRRALAKVGITTLLVTHEQEEAFHLGDRVAVLGGGRLHQVGTPEELYERPATRFVAGFVGRASALPGTFLGLEGAAARMRIVAGDTEVCWTGEAAEGLAAGQRVELLVRPEALELRPAGGFEALPGRVVERRYAGHGTYYTVALDGGTAEVEALAGPHTAAPGETVHVGLRRGTPLPRIFPLEGAA